MATAVSFAVPPIVRWSRSVGAVAAGLLINALLATATDLLLVLVGVFPPLSDFGNPAAYGDDLLLLALLYRAGFGVLGCYVTAWLAPTRPMSHALALGCIGAVLCVSGAVATWDAWPHWYSVALIAVTLPSSWLGAKLVQLRRAARDSKP